MSNFSEEFLAKMPAELWPGVLAICKAARESVDGRGFIDFDTYLEAYALLTEFTDSHGCKTPQIDSQKSRTEVLDQILAVFAEMEKSALKESDSINLGTYRERFRNHFSKVIVFELSDGDVSRVQELVNLLRKEISQCETLTQSHRQRVLSRLEKLQSEIHKKESDFDKYYGIAVEIIALAKKAGEAAQPWAKCVREILQIVWNAQSRALGLPSTTPMEFLPTSEKQDT